MDPLPHPNLDRVYTFMGYQPFQIVLAGAVLFGGMQLNQSLKGGWWGIGLSLAAAFAVLRLSALLRDRFPGRAFAHLRANVSMAQRYVPGRDRQHVPLVLELELDEPAQIDPPVQDRRPSR